MTLGNHSGGLSVQQEGYLEGSYALILISADQTNQIKPPSTKHKQQMAHRSRQSGCMNKKTLYYCGYLIHSHPKNVIRYDVHYFSLSAIALVLYILLHYCTHLIHDNLPLCANFLGP